jgi:hypothetical protein
MTTPPTARAAALEVDEKEASESLCVSVAPRSPPAGGVLCVLLESVCCYLGFLLYTGCNDCDSCHRHLQLALVVLVRQRRIWSIMHAVAQNLLRFWYEGSFPNSCMMSRSCKHRNNDMRWVLRVKRVTGE